MWPGTTQRMLPSMAKYSENSCDQVPNSDRADSSCMVSKTKGASRHMHFISEKQLTKELRRLNLWRQNWSQKALAQGKRMQRWILLKNMPQYCHSNYRKGSGVQRRLCWGVEVQDPDNSILILPKLMDFESYYATKCPRAMLCSGVTREWVDEGRLPKKQTQLEVAKALRCDKRGHT
ncbi:hypothetical protein BHM03_00029292 [Ensete ventricosum]|nr:hypothetical protein BHM03_00029292 [Ensete ventricosum]